nr:MAG TPA: hypothetical protein [Caudoviricetes sp.]
MCKIQIMRTNFQKLIKPRTILNLHIKNVLMVA